MDNYYIDVRDKILDGDFESAQDLIDDLQRRLERTPKTSHNFLTYKEQLSDLRKQYNRQLNIAFKNVNKGVDKTTEVYLNSVEHRGVKRTLQFYDHVYIDRIPSCTKLDIRNSKYFGSSKIECEGTVFMRNIVNCNAFISANCIRMLQCTNIVLVLDRLPRGIFIQDTTRVEIRLIDEKIGFVSYVNMLDFDFPLDSPNVKFTRYRTVDEMPPFGFDQMIQTNSDGLDMMISPLSVDPEKENSIEKESLKGNTEKETAFKH